MASLSLRHIYKKYPGGVTAVSDFNLEIKDKEFLVLVGPSGCGKSTTLRMVAGLEEISEGELFIGDRLVNDVAPKDRKIAMVFQNYALYPHMSVYENMAFGLKLNKTPKEEIKRRVEEAARILDITHLLDRKPKALSGGQKQRVALGRAIVRNPMVFLLDEPLSNLDAKLRATMRSELTKLHERVQTTFIYVTHDQVEAMTMATRIVVMKDGLIQQVETPQNLYDNPVNIFVAGFIGTPQMNFINGVIEKKGEDLFFNFENNSLRLPADSEDKEALADYVGKEVIAGLRPECFYDDPMHMNNDPLLKENQINAYIDVTELMGSEIHLHFYVCKKDIEERFINNFEKRLDKDVIEEFIDAKLDDPEKKNYIARVSSHSVARHGAIVPLAVDTRKMHIFDKDTERTVLHFYKKDKSKK